MMREFFNVFRVFPEKTFGMYRESSAGRCGCVIGTCQEPCLWLNQEILG